MLANNEEDDEKWNTEYGIKFSLATLDDIEEVKEFMLREFFPDEPISRSIGVATGNSLVDKYGRYLACEDLLVNPIKKNGASVLCSIIARSDVDNCIVGCRIGAIYSKKERKNEGYVPNFLGNLPACFGVPHKFICGVNLQSLQADLHYSQQDAFSELEATDSVYFAADTASIYFATCLTVSGTTRGKGLGSELVKRAYKIARDAGCKYTYVMATGVYSQRIFHKLGNARVLHEARYADYEYDKKGRPFLSDTREHPVAQILAIDHGV